MPEADNYFIYSFFLRINNYLCKSLQMSYTESVATTWAKKKKKKRIVFLGLLLIAQLI